MKRNEIDKLLMPKIIEPTEINREVKIQHTGRQLVVQIPAEVAYTLDIEKGDFFVFKIPLSNKKQYSIKFKKQHETKAI